MKIFINAHKYNGESLQLIKFANHYKWETCICSILKWCYTIHMITYIGTIRNICILVCQRLEFLLRASSLWYSASISCTKPFQSSYISVRRTERVPSRAHCEFYLQCLPPATMLHLTDRQFAFHYRARIPSLTCDTITEIDFELMDVVVRSSTFFVH